MERSATSHAPRFTPRVSEAPPAPRWRMLSWSVGLGTLLLAGSVVVAALAAYTPSRADSPAASNGHSQLRAVAIAFVDVPDGIRNLYPVQPGRVMALPVKEDEEVAEGTPLLLLDDSLAKLKQAQVQVAVDCARERLVQAKQLLKQHKIQIRGAKAAVDAAKSDKEACAGAGGQGPVLPEGESGQHLPGRARGEKRGGQGRGRHSRRSGKTRRDRGNGARGGRQAG